jgi:hypothetical protein
MSLQIAVTTGCANSITPWHEVENLKTILVQSLEAVQMFLGLLAGDSKHREDI